MRPSLGPALGLIHRLVSGLLPGRRDPVRVPDRRRRSPELMPLEERKLMVFSPTTVTVNPTTLFPPNGRFVPVTVSGTFQELALIDGGVKTVPRVLPGAKNANFQVVDEYHQVEPTAPIQLVPADPANATFNFSFTVDLPASRSTRFPAGRRYYIIVAAQDSDGWNGRTVAVQVPISLNDRGQGPVVAPASKNQPNHAQAAHPKAATHPRAPAVPRSRSK